MSGLVFCQHVARNCAPFEAFRPVSVQQSSFLPYADAEGVRFRIWPPILYKYVFDGMLPRALYRYAEVTGTAIHG
jgi:hypothetical protein